MMVETDNEDGKSDGDHGHDSGAHGQDDDYTEDGRGESHTDKGDKNDCGDDSNSMIILVMRMMAETVLIEVTRMMRWQQQRVAAMATVISSPLYRSFGFSL